MSDFTLTEDQKLRLDDMAKLARANALEPWAVAAYFRALDYLHEYAQYVNECADVELELGPPEPPEEWLMAGLENDRFESRGDLAEGIVTNDYLMLVALGHLKIDAEAAELDVARNMGVL